jgi:ribonuclease Y
MDVNEQQKRAIIDVINLLKNQFDIKDNDSVTIDQSLNEKQQQIDKKNQELTIKENEFRQLTSKELNQIRQHKNSIRKQQFEIKQQLEDIDKKLYALSSQEKSIKKAFVEFKEKEKEFSRQLEQISCISKDDAIKLLCSTLENEARIRANNVVKQIINEANSNAQVEAKNILLYAIQKETINIVAEFATCTIDLPNEAIKGKIIGREGRNVRLFEELTGVSVIIDDSPEIVVLSCYDPVKRDIAKIAMQKLILDGRIHQKRIEEAVEHASKQIDDEMKVVATKVLNKFQIVDVHLEIAKLIGKLKYRSSYSQNVLDHSCEVAFIAGDIAAELKLDKKLLTRAGLLHDIGKSVDRLLPGSHAELGAEIAKNFCESDQVCKIIAEHHEENVTSINSWIVKIADTLSSARPGVRQDTFGTYIKRLEDLEKIALSFNGIKTAFAISAGRELRIIVDAEQVNDSDVNMLAENIKEKIEKTMIYPGQINVVVVRETKCIKIAN